MARYMTINKMKLQNLMGWGWGWEFHFQIQNKPETVFVKYFNEQLAWLKGKLKEKKPTWIIQIQYFCKWIWWKMVCIGLKESMPNHEQHLEKKVVEAYQPSIVLHLINHWINNKREFRSNIKKRWIYKTSTRNWERIFHDSADNYLFSTIFNLEQKVSEIDASTHNKILNKS